MEAIRYEDLTELKRVPGCLGGSYVRLEAKTAGARMLFAAVFKPEVTAMGKVRTFWCWKLIVRRLGVHFI